MIIVSQDKKRIVNFEAIDFIDIMPMDDERFELDANFAHCITELGYYETEKRAKEVLEEIMKNYEISIDYMYNKTLFVKDLEEYRQSLVYEMPKE